MRPPAALSQLAADLEVGEPTYAGVGDQGYGPVAPDFLQAQLRALAGQLPAPTTRDHQQGNGPSPP